MLENICCKFEVILISGYPGKRTERLRFLQAEKMAAEIWKRAQVPCSIFYQNAITLAIIELSEIWLQILGLHKVLNMVDMKYFFGILDKGGGVRPP